MFRASKAKSGGEDFAYRGRKRARALSALLLALSLALSSCGAGENGEGKGDGSHSSASADGNVIKGRVIVEGGGSGPEIFYQNNISTEFASYSRDEGRIHGDYIVISGLEDAAVQKKINDAIRDGFFALAEKEEIPPYTGWRIKTQGASENERNISCYVYGSFNNILSLQLYCWRSFRGMDRNGNWMNFYMSEAEPMNFDLRTGEELKLADVFREGTDHIAFLDSYMEKLIAENDSYDDTAWAWGSSSDLRLSGPFRGVREDQKFLINDYSGRLVLVFDYNDPEVCNYFYPVTVMIEDVSALDYEGFIAGGLASADKALHPILVTGDHEMTESPYAPDPPELGDRDIDYRCNIMSYDVLTERQKALMGEREPETEAVISELIENYDSFRERFGPGIKIYATLEEDASCSFFGPYRVIYKSCWAYASPEFTTEQEYVYYNGGTNTRYYVFNRDGDEPLSIEDMFREGTDWKEAVKAAARKNLDEQGISPYFDYDSYAGEVLERLTSFHPTGNTLILEFGDVSDLNAKYLAAGDDNWYYLSGIKYVEYTNLEGALAF
ncbi:MAG: hypothetical protein II971_00690 [Firmicutes bacterium]|nr:hypothetical protein [Bacillota bacterium]